MDIQWRKSSFSEDNDGNCVELALCGAAVLMRESDDPGTVIEATPQKLRALLSGIKSDAFGHMPSSREAG
ncbi:DUF397 domain-containing protein [Streptomyces sp. O3]